MANLTLTGILEKMTDKDKDYRYMATSYLFCELSKDNFKADSDLEIKLSNIIIQQLDDAAGDVSELAVKCLAPMVKKVTEGRVVEMTNKLCDKLLNEKDQHRDVDSIALKTIVSEVSVPSLAQSILISLSPKLIKGITAPEFPGLSTEIKCESLDILCDVLHKFGNLMASDHEILLGALLSQLSSKQASFIKKTVSCIASLASSLSDDLLAKATVDVVRNLKSKGVKAEMTRTNIQMIGALSRAVGYRFGPHLAYTVPLLISYCKSASENDEELREYNLQALESFLLRCPKDVASYCDEILHLTLEYMSYDPNFTDNMDDEEDDLFLGEDLPEEYKREVLIRKILNYKSTRKKLLFESQPSLQRYSTVVSEYVKALMQVDWLDGSELLKTLQRGISIASREEEGKGEECSSSPVGEYSGLPHICFAGLSEDKATLRGEHITSGVVIENLNAEVVKAVMLVDSAQICEDTLHHGKDNVCGLDVSAGVRDAAKCKLNDVSERSIELRKKLNGLENTERMAMEEIEKLRLHCKSVEAKDEEHLATIDERRRELDLVKRQLPESEEMIANLESKTHEILQEKEEKELEKGGLELMIEELKRNLKQLNSTEMSLTGAKKLVAAKILELEKNLHEAFQNNPDMVIEIKKLAGELKEEKKAIQMLINKHDSLEPDLNLTREQSKGAAYKIENLIREKEMEEEKVKGESTILDLQRELGKLNVDLVRLDDKCRVEEEKSKQLITKVNHRSSVLGRMTLGKEHATKGLDAERMEAEKLRLELSCNFSCIFILEDNDILRGRICHGRGLVINYTVGLPRKRHRA